MVAGRPVLDTPDYPIAIRPEHTTVTPTNLHIRQHLSWSNGDWTAKGADGATFLTTTGKVWSNSARKEFQDASGLPLFTLRRSWISVAKAWRLELPSTAGDEIATIRLHWSLGRIKLDLKILSNAASNEDESNAASAVGKSEVLLEVRGQDPQHYVTNILHEGRKVAVVKRVFDERDRAGFKMKPEYEVEVAEGVDLSLVSFYLAAWREERFCAGVGVDMRTRLL